jgi:hypothetical protein
MGERRGGLPPLTPLTTTRTPLTTTMRRQPPLHPSGLNGDIKNSTGVEMGSFESGVLSSSGRGGGDGGGGGGSGGGSGGGGSDRGGVWFGGSGGGGSDRGGGSGSGYRGGGGGEGRGRGTPSGGGGGGGARVLRVGDDHRITNIVPPSVNTNTSKKPSPSLIRLEVTTLRSSSSGSGGSGGGGSGGGATDLVVVLCDVRGRVLRQSNAPGAGPAVAPGVRTARGGGAVQVDDPYKLKSAWFHNP